MLFRRDKDQFVSDSHHLVDVLNSFGDLREDLGLLRDGEARTRYSGFDDTEVGF